MYFPVKFKYSINLSLTLFIFYKTEKKSYIHVPGDIDVPYSMVCQDKILDCTAV